MAIPLMSGFQLTSDSAIDSRLTLTKTEMLAMKDSGMPDTYFCTDSETGEIYTYNKTNTVDPTTGKFRKFAGGGGSDSSFKGTRDEWNKLSEAEKEKYDGQQIIFTDDVLKGEYDIGTYSTKEMRVGTWINGDSIYRIVLTNLNVIPKSASWVDTGINISFAKKLIDLKCYRESGGSMGYMLLSRINEGTKTLGIYSGSTYNIPVNTIVLEYTK